MIIMKTTIKYIYCIIVFILISNQTFAQNCIGTAGQVKWSYWTGLNDYNTDTTDLFALENFPSRPDGFQMLGSLKTPVNFNDHFASMIRGFIKVPVTANYIFNITSDDRSLFFLSTTQSPANKVKRAEVLTYTGQTQYTKEPGQTSTTIQLIGGQYYYFEMYNFEGGGGDFMNLQWRKAAETTVIWSVIDFNYIYEYTCGQVCSPRGTACNDGNAQTTNDQQDGFCNCVGTYPTANACVGTKGLTEAYYYDNITGSYVENDLIDAPKFPLLPDRKEKLNGAYGPLVPYSNDNYGTLVQGFLTVPVSGIYEFNITGDNQTFFFLSKNDSIEFKQYHQAMVISGISETDHNSSVFQSIAPLYMEKGKFYYFEFRHKENGWRDHFNLFWKTPFHEKRDWKRVSNFYLYDYKCEISCIAQNTPCDDGNPFTNNDKINGQCECVGTPCSGPDCDDSAARYKTYDSCTPTDNLTTLAEASWVSCTNTIPNPNAARASNPNWIRYDFTDRYKFNTSRIWNYNVVGQTDKGFKNVYVDYSTDGTTWQTLGTSYLWQQAPGTADYSGFTGPNFNNVKARYILISAIDNWGGGCAGFSKIKFDASLCNPSGTPCNDNDPLTSYDKFDANCNCKGVDINCANDTLKLDNTSLADGAFKAIKSIEAKSMVPVTKDISFVAGNSIVLLPGFEVKNNAIFVANIEDCLQAAFSQNQKENTKNIADTTSLATKNTESAKVKEIIFRLTKPAYVKLFLKDKNDKVVVEILDHYFENLGTQTKLLPTNKLAKGTYWIELEVDKTILKEQILVE
jgi:PA14 domain/F5/8 type C domain